MSHFSVSKIMALTTILSIPPVYAWYRFYIKWKSTQKANQEKLLFQQRHQCVVSYQGMNGFSGWPPHLQRCKGTKENTIQDLYEPILYFIRTAESSLDIAVMFIHVNVIYTELTNALRRGVKLRLILNFRDVSGCIVHIKNLCSLGALCQFYLAPAAMIDSIMHHKYMVKDLTDQTGYLCTGSMNFSVTAVMNNYEIITFVSDYKAVRAYWDNFEDTWKKVNLDNEGMINTMVLLESGL